MRFLATLLFTFSTLFSANYFSLDDVNSLHLHMSNKLEFMDEKQKKSLKKDITDKLKKAGFKFGKVDSINFLVKLKSVEIDEGEVVHISIGLGENVTASRGQDIDIFAYTFYMDTLLEADEPYEETIYTINRLISKFIDAHKFDNEQ
ncbi:hypothetical protein [Sulfurimonas sp.]|uniref:hypothetical protein n=1 Tax=Sulfurimonas sp. TaxID=2022749 RepID=UPI002B47D6BA|nr:hypothetical protein [Sulfurimonas sp.]